MIRSVNHTTKFTIAATDGDIGSVDTFYFDDERWAIRYVVVDTGKWLQEQLGRPVPGMLIKAGRFPPAARAG